MVKVALAQALPPIYLYLVPLIGVAFLLALTSRSGSCAHTPTSPPRLTARSRSSQS